MAPPSSNLSVAAVAWDSEHTCVCSLGTPSFPRLILYHRLSFVFQARTVKQCWLPVPQTRVRMLLFVKRHPILRASAACVLLAGKVMMLDASCTLNKAIGPSDDMGDHADTYNLCRELLAGRPHNTFSDSIFIVLK